MKIIGGFENWSELELLAGMIIGEARGEKAAGKIGVALTAKTRADHPRWWGRNMREVVLCKYQFSCWMDHNAEIISDHRNLKSMIWSDCLRIADDVYTGNTIDFVGKPTHYHTVSIFPDWASGMKKLATIGNHIFYRDTSEIKDV